MTPPAQHILICLHDFPAGGTERIAIRMAKHWVDAGRRVSILCGTEAGVQRASVHPRVDVLQLNPPLSRSPLSRFKLGKAMAKRLAEIAPDIIFLPGNFHLFLANNLKTASNCAPIALKISNPPVSRGPFASIERSVFKHFAWGVDGLAAMNRGLESDLRTLLPQKQVTTCYDPVYTVDTAKREARRAGTPVNIVWAGRLEPQKNVPLALATIAALRRLTTAHLTLVGDGRLRRKTEADIVSLGLSDTVTLVGHVNSVDPYFADADALLITSRFEGGPAVAVEALAQGVPVVGTDCSHFLHESLTIPEAGQIVSQPSAKRLAHALLSVVGSPRPDTDRLAALVEPFGPERCATRYLHWLDQLARQA